MTKKEFNAINVNEATKSDLLTALEGLPKTVTDDNLLDRVKYTITQAKKSIKKVTVADLKDLVTEAQELLTASVPTPVEAAKKPAPKTKKASDTSDTDEAEAPKKSKKSLKKPGMKTASPKTKASKALPVASMFPEELSFEADDGEKTLVCVHDKYHTMQEVRKAIEEGNTLFIATYWTKRHIKEYNYSDTFKIPNAPKSFPDDLDMLNIVVACDNIDRVWAMSTYTEAAYSFDGNEFEPVEDEDPTTGEKFTVRVSNGMEFEVYEIAE